jgi:hypothetical protein
MPVARIAVTLLAVLLTVALRSSAAGPAEVDPGTPKGTMKAFYEAMEAGDAAAVRASFHTASDAEKELADAYAAQLVAARALGEATKAKFATAGDALSKGLPLRDEIARLDSAEVVVDGDKATLKIAGQPRPLRLFKVDGRWRLSLADYAGDDLTGQAAALRDMAAVFQAIATDIQADKFATPADAQRALQQKLQAVLFNTLQRHPPTTARAMTRPAKP